MLYRDIIVSLYIYIEILLTPQFTVCFATARSSSEQNYLFLQLAVFQIEHVGQILDGVMLI